MVLVENFSVMFGNFCAVDDISFSVKRGEIFGFLGANGAGKTTTIRVLCGLLYPTKGKVTVAGIKFDSKDAEMAIKRKVGYMSQRFTLYNDLTVEENLSFIATLHRLDAKTYLKRRDYILDFISFARPLTSFVRSLPGGIKQQISLAAAILHDPDVVFLDEPTAGVTPAMRARFWDLIKDLARLGKTIFVTTHYMDEAEQCERIALMRTGKIVALDTPDNLKKMMFPDKLYEFEARGEISYSYIQKLKVRPEFEYFEPFGLRFHAAFKESSEVEEFKKELESDFIAKEIRPTLEDVFIRTTETK
ncbi:MAG: ABC transporter ATP-binding protein [Gammaproteobacteria bacterium]|nr:ABC transporter ATP-binding protein [Gammaproteobacteria bacterium]